MFYWAPGSTASAARIYRESAATRRRPAPRGRVEVPVGVRGLPAARSYRPPRRWVEPHYNVARWTDMPRGGHFAALEEPELLLDDVRAFFRALR